MARQEAASELAFARALIAARASKGLTQSQLAELIGTRQPNIARLESGRGRPSVAMLEKLARALEISFEISQDAGLHIKYPVISHQ